MVYTYVWALPIRLTHRNGRSRRHDPLDHGPLVGYLPLVDQCQGSDGRL